MQQSVAICMLQQVIMRTWHMQCEAVHIFGSAAWCAAIKCHLAFCWLRLWQELSMQCCMPCCASSLLGSTSAIRLDLLDRNHIHILFSCGDAYVCLCECEVSNNKFPQPYPQNPTKIIVHRDLLKIFLSQQFQPAAVTAVALGARAQRPRALASCRCTCVQRPVV